MDDEATLLERLRAGDSESFHTVFTRYSDELFRYAQIMLGDRGLAEDVVQECFIGLLGGRFDPNKGELRKYLFTIARNLISKTLQKISKSTINSIEQISEEYHPQTEDSQLDRILSHEQLEQCKRAVYDLPYDFREILILHEYQNLTIQEISSLLDLKQGTVASRLGRARRKIRKQLEVVSSR
ncbi:MAG: RNA polymerase sigma factor [Acidobacteriota bacterium]